MTKIVHKVPPLPTREQIEKVLEQHIRYKPSEAKALADGVCKLLMESPIAMHVINAYANDDKDGDVPLHKAGSIFTGGFLTGFMVAYAMMKLEEN